MATAVAETCAPDTVLSFSIIPGTLPQFLTAMEECGPRLKCFDGSVTLVASGLTHGMTSAPVGALIFVVCSELESGHVAVGSITWTRPEAREDTAYEADQSYYIQSYKTAAEGQMPDLAIEIVVSTTEQKALACGAALGIPELWVYDVPHRRLYHLTTRGKHRGTYQSKRASRAFPFLIASEVLQRLEDPDRSGIGFFRNSREWTQNVLKPRYLHSGHLGQLRTARRAGIGRIAAGLIRACLWTIEESTPDTVASFQIRSGSLTQSFSTIV